MLPRICDKSHVIKAQQQNVIIAITGITAHTGMIGWTTFPAISKEAIGGRTNMCIRYIPKEYLDREIRSFGDLVCLIHVANKRIPIVWMNIFGVQNSQAHSNTGVSMI